MKTEREGTRRGVNLSAVCNIPRKHIYDCTMLGEVFRDNRDIIGTREEKTFLQCASLDCTLMIALVLGEMFRDNR